MHDEVRGEAEGDVCRRHEVREASESVLRRHRMPVCVRSKFGKIYNRGQSYKRLYDRKIRL